ncbi:MAG: hypothetical protein ER33_07075 [Cyanobium sp. CACIAM 14]|nr:MAG: hypothetical protein ER33_07075 [Cyanobium sp. CACIAM 14]
MLTMGRRLRSLIFGGSILSIGSLLVFMSVGHKRNASIISETADRLADLTCAPTQATEFPSNARPLPVSRAETMVRTSTAEVLSSSEVDAIQLDCQSNHPSIRPLMPSRGSASSLLLTWVKNGREPAQAGMKLSARQPLPDGNHHRDSNNAVLSSSNRMGPVASGRLQQISARDQQLAWDLSSQGPLAEPIERDLAIALVSFGVLFTAINLAVSRHFRRKERRLMSSLRTDEQTLLLSRFALANDLELAAQHDSPDQHRKAMLVTIFFRFLERQRAFLNENEIAMIISGTCKHIQQMAPSYSYLDFYRTGETKCALIIPATNDNLLHTKDDCESILADLLALVSESLQQSREMAIDWGDVVITGQRFVPGASPSSLLSLQAVGEMLASEDRLSCRLMEEGDDTLLLERSLVKAQLTQLRAEDLDLRFQPILLVHNPGQFGLELLIRFRPHALHNLGTGKVLELAHDLGIAHRIDALVISRLEEVHQALRKSEILRERIDYISVNISSDSASSEDRLNQLIRNLKKHRVDSSTFCIEITETAATDIPVGSINVTTASERLIKELNFRVLIDDFGSGLSNYRRICEAWYDAIKLDINLVKGIHLSFRLQRYIGSFISTVHALGKTVVCEGIETYNEMTAAVRLGADALQGHFISRPLALEEVITFLDTSTWASPVALQKQLAKIHSSARLLDLRSNEDGDCTELNVPLERYILDNWSRLRSFEEFVLLFVNELKRWGLDILRFSLAFLPDQDDIDCSQYVWQGSSPGKVTTLRFERDFLQKHEHLSSPLHYIATATRIFRHKPSSTKGVGFNFLEGLKAEGCSDYLGIRLESRGISIPVLTIALHGGTTFSDEQIQRIEAMSSLLSLLFYAFESERSKRLALLDPLTMLANRRSFDSFLKSNIASSKLTSSFLALVMIDIDQFKMINDVMGHGYGDHCLKEVALLLNASIHRKNDFLARLGGEEFAIILPDTDTASALELCESLRESIEKKAIYHPDPLKGNCLTVSIGIAIWDPNSHAVCDFDTLQQLADDCLYEAKRNGRNRVVCRSLGGYQSVAV